MKCLIILALCLSALLLIGSLNLPLTYAIQGQVEWGSRMNVKSYVAVGNNNEIPKDNWAYVFTKAPETKHVGTNDWNRMLAGDLSSIVDQIKTQISGCEPVWIRISWDNATYVIHNDQTGMWTEYLVTGFMIEAIVQNINAGLTGLEIVAIIMVISFIIAVIAAIGTLIWVTWQIMDATKQIGPWATVIVGLIIFIGLLSLVYFLFGGKFSYKGKTRKLSLEGKKRIFHF